MYARLQVKRKKRDCVNEFLDGGRNHDGPEANGVTRDDDEGNLPGQSDADESVIKAGVSDGRRVLTADRIEHEIQGRELDQTEYARDKEYGFRKFHLFAADGEAVNPDGRGRHRAAEFQIIRHFGDVHEHVFQVSGNGDFFDRISKLAAGNPEP